MDPWFCALLISVAGAVGGTVNALLTDNGFVLPRREMGIWCPGFLSNVMVGSFSAVASWSFYGSWAGVDLATAAERARISLTFSALAGAFLVGVAGSRWITNEVDKRLLTASVKEAAKKDVDPEECERLARRSPRELLHSVKQSPPAPGVAAA